MSEQPTPASDNATGTPQDDVTHFGFRNVPKSQKAGQVAEVFHSVAGKYDMMNDLMSMGIHRLWKRFTIELSGVRPGHQVLDIAGGTGDLTMKFSDLVGASGKVVLADINASMLQVGRGRLVDRGYAGNIEYVQADAEHLPFPDNTFLLLNTSEHFSHFPVPLRRRSSAAILLYSRGNHDRDL